jgi:hypothetical protein
MGTTGRIEELLAAWERAADKPPPEQLCADCPELIDQLRARIRARSTAAPAPAANDGDRRAAPPHAFAEPAPKQIGPYRVLELLGEGGMGSVYRAEQRSPIKRVVAIKVIKSGYDTREVIARFESERQAKPRTLEPLMSRWMMAFVCAWVIASQTWQNRSSRCGSDNLFSSQNLGSGTPGTCSITKYGRAVSTVAPASRTRAMFGWSIRASG